MLFNDGIIDIFSHWQANDQFGGGTSRFVRQELRRSTKDGNAEGFEQLLAELPRGLQSAGILIVSDLLDSGGSGATVDELAGARGLGKPLIYSCLRKLRKMGIVESVRHWCAPSTHFIDPGAFEELHARRQEFCTYKGGLCRLDRSLEHAHNRVLSLIGEIAEKGGDAEALKSRERKLVKQRISVLSDIYPEMTPDELEIWVTTHQAPVAKGSKAPDMPEPGALAWYRLVDLTGKELLSVDEFGELQELDRVLGAGAVTQWQGVVDVDRTARARTDHTVGRLSFAGTITKSAR